MSLAAWMPSSLRFFSICLLRARAARSSADMAQPILLQVAFTNATPAFYKRDPWRSTKKISRNPRTPEHQARCYRHGGQRAHHHRALDLRSHARARERARTHARHRLFSSTSARTTARHFPSAATLASLQPTKSLVTRLTET